MKNKGQQQKERINGAHGPKDIRHRGPREKEIDEKEGEGEGKQGPFPQ